MEIPFERLVLRGFQNSTRAELNVISFELDQCYRQVRITLGRVVSRNSTYNEIIYPRLIKICEAARGGKQDLLSYGDLLYSYNYLAIAGEFLKSAYKKFRSQYRRMVRLSRGMKRTFPPSGSAYQQLARLELEIRLNKVRLEIVHQNLQRDTAGIAELAEGWISSTQ